MWIPSVPPVVATVDWNAVVFKPASTDAAVAVDVVTGSLKTVAVITNIES